MAFLSCARGAALLALATGFIGSDIEADVVDLFGVNELTLTWAPADGPVAGYYVVVHRNGGEGTVEKLAAEPTASVGADFGDELSVSVAAFDAAGVAGPLSPRSDTFRFNLEAEEEPLPEEDGDTTLDGGSDPLPATGVGTPLDFTGDGVSDLLLRAPDGALELLAMEGAVAVASQALPYLDTSFSVVGNGDYDGNGLADLLWEEDGTGRLVVWGMHGGVPDEGVVLDVVGLASGDEWRVGGSGDFDGDGHDDILLFSRVLGDAELLYMRDGALAGQSRLPGYVGAWSVATSGDFDGDGRDEILWRDEVGEGFVLWHPDLGGSDAGIPVALSAAGLHVVGSGDFDDDGREDVFLQQYAPKQLKLWRMDGQEFVAAVSIADERADTWRAAGVGDYDADGRSDLVWSDPPSGRIELWFSDGSGVTREPVAIDTNGATVVSGNDGTDDTQFRTRLCGDFNGDGAVTISDTPFLRNCLADPTAEGCEAADMDSDGTVNMSDVTLFVKALGIGTCVE